jgi:AraC family transcriptional regulator
LAVNGLASCVYVEHRLPVASRARFAVEIPERLSEGCHDGHMLAAGAFGELILDLVNADAFARDALSLGETVSDTVRRLRLHRAASDLLDRELSIERAAHRAGYAGRAAFTRAFRVEYGRPPARYRGARRVAELDQKRNPTMYQVETITVPRVRVAAIRHRGDYQLAGRAFERLMAVAATTGLLTPDTRSIGVFYDDPASVPEAELRSAACITVPDDWAPSGEVTEAQIEGGRYARIVHTGPYTELKTAYDWLYQTWLPNSAEEPRDLPCIEEYLNNPRQVPAKDLETAVMMPLVG